MPTFKYLAKDGPIKTKQGVIEAQTKEEAVEKISQLGYLPVRVDEDIFVARSRSSLLPFKVKSRHITILTRQLASLIKSGVPILQSLSTVSEQSESPHISDMLNNISREIRDGQTLSGALSQYPKIFSSLYISLVRTGENSGNLTEALSRIAEYRQRQEEIISKVRTAMAYPILMAIVGIATIIFMLTFVMPRLTHIFSTMGQNLPFPTRVLINLSAGLRQWWMVVLLIFVFVLFLFRRFLKTRAYNVVGIHLPLLGHFTRRVEIARFSRTLELLLKSGLQILKSIEIAIPVLNNKLLQDELKRCHTELQQGTSFGRQLKKSKLFPPFMSNLIIVGEESGRLDEVLGEIANTYERETDETLKILTSLLEPLMILLTGLVVGFIVIAMLLPIFQMNLMVE